MPKKQVILRSRKFADIYKTYLHRNIKLKWYQTMGIIFLIVVISGCFGWSQELFFIHINTGSHAWYLSGGNFLPWINLYAIGAMLIIAVTYRWREYPWLVFLISMVAAGALELLAGWLVYTVGNGTRYWDYSGEPWNFGNIGGFVCLLSAFGYGLGSLLLMYVVLPLCISWSRRLHKNTFIAVSSILFALVMVDEITNRTMKNLNLPTAMDFYRSMGFQYYEGDIYKPKPQLIEQSAAANYRP